MLSPKRESLAGKLLLSSALVAVSLAYGWWQRPIAHGPALAMAPRPASANRAASLPPSAAAAPAAPETQDAPSGVTDAPGPAIEAAAPPPPAAIAKARPTIAPSVTPAPPEPQQNTDSPPSPPPALTPQQALQMNLPTQDAPPLFPLVTGSPDPGAVAAVPAGAHLQDGDYVSDKHELNWGDLRVKISIQGGLIAGVQVVEYPDHRSQSLYLSQLAIPVLESEVIKSQKAQVDTVSSATDTSYTFQDTVADAIAKATRG